MKKKYSLIFLISICYIGIGFGQSEVIISQYIETDSGSTPKGIEIMNVSGAEITFSAGNNLQVYQGTNGAACSTSIVNITSGILAVDEVWVIGTSDLVTYANTNGTDLSGTTTFAFTFNGDDALSIYLGGALQDQFGTCGSDPGASWSGGGVSTANNNLQILNGLCDGDIDGWTDPSTRFSQIANGSTMAGFGSSSHTCGVSSTPTITVNPTSLAGLDYVETLGPSTEQTFTVEGTLLTTDIVLTAPTNFEVSTVSGSGFGTSINLTPTLGSVTTTTIYTRLVSGLTANTYSGTLTATSTGATTQNVSLEGTVTAAGGDCANESFANIPTASSTSYLTRTWTGDDGIGWTATDARTDQTINTQSITIRNGTLLSGTFSGGIGDLTITTQRKFTGSTGTLDLVVNGISVGSIPYDATVQTTTISGINVSGNVVVEIGPPSVNGDRVAIDDISWTCYTGLPTPEIQLADNTATNQNCGYTINFGSQALSSNTDLTFDIKNVGSADLTISSFGISGDYSIVSPTAPFTVTSGNSQTVTVRFTPTVNGTRTGTLTINNDDSNEGTCTVNLTGIGYTPAPEIDIERNTNASIPNGASASTGYNTIFATTTIGSSTAPKTFYVHNEGTANLSITSITTSNSEFSISTNPAPITLLPDELATFEITFSPVSASPTTRTATITINSNDADENPYTFAVQGTAQCAATPITITPASGPENTIITVLGANFGVSTTASLNGSSAPVTVISSTEIEVTVPSGATTGSLQITNDLGCVSSELFTVVDSIISGCEGSVGLTPSELFISEITDHGTGSHSYVEIFNGTGATVNLSGYQIRVHNNGASTATNTVALSGSIVNGDVFVLAFGSTEATDPHASHGYDQVSTISGINEDDNIRLYNGSTWVDLWGDTSGSSFTVAPKDYTYRRKNSGITAPSTTWNASDWDSFTPVDYTDIGYFDFSTGIPPSITVEPNAPSSSCDVSASITVVASEGFVGGNALAYQWYFSAPGDAGWTIVSNNTTYSGATSATLTISSTLTLNNYQYYCEVREDDATCYQASNAVKLTVDVVTWDGSSWSPTTPDNTKIAIIDGNYTTNATNGSFEACQLLINSTYLLTIANGYYVSVENDVVVDGEIYVQKQGSLVQVQDSGTFTLNNALAKNTLSKDTAPLQFWYDYTYWSSPLEDAQIETALFSSRPSRRYYFDASLFDDLLIETNNSGSFTSGQDDIDDTGDDWVVQSTGKMNPGVGYAATHDNIGFLSGNQYQYIFEGTLANGGAFNTGNIDVDIYIDPGVSYNSWNLIGNPYPCAIDAVEFFNDNSTLIEGTIYLWSSDTDVNTNNSGNQGYNFSQNDYAQINGGGGVASSNGSPIPNGYVASGQGFFVIGKKAGASSGVGYYTSSVFNNSMRVTGNNNQFFRTSSSNVNNRLWVNLTSDNGVFNQVLVGYFTNATDSYDGMFYDAPRNLSTGQHAMLYSTIDGNDTKFSIQGKAQTSLDLNEIISLGFSTSITAPTSYTIGIAQLEGDFLTNNTIYLKDNLLNLYHDISASDYNFTSAVGEFNDRFEIVFQTNLLSVDNPLLTPDGLTIVDMNDGSVKFIVGGTHTISKVEILDLLGRSLYNLDGSHSEEIYYLPQLSQSTYIARVTLSNGQLLTKKAVKR